MIASPPDLSRAMPAANGSAPAVTGLPELWAETMGDPRIRVAILDGPADRAHPCFVGARLTTLPTSVREAPGLGRMSAHGTHIASLIFGQPGGPVHGVAPGCHGLLAPIFSDERPEPASQASLARAIYQAVEAGAHLINISGGESVQDLQPETSLAEAVRFCREHGVLIVAAAGNDGCRCLHVPAALPSVLAVGALGANGLPLESSNWGDVYLSQGILAPGENLPGALPGGRIGGRTGTSFATPLVAAAIALLLSWQLKRGSTPDPFSIREAILATAQPCHLPGSEPCRRFLAGILNLSGARALLSNRRNFAMSDELRSSEIHPTIDGVEINGLALSGILPHESGGSSACAVSEPAAEIGVQPQSAPQASASINAETGAPGILPGRAERRHVTLHSSGAGLAAAAASDVSPSACDCQRKPLKQFVYVIGTLGYDFGTEARRDGFAQLMPSVNADGSPYVPDPNNQHPYPPNPYDPRQLVNYLRGYPEPAPPYPIAGGFPQPPETVAAPALPPCKTERTPLLAASLSDAAELIWTLNVELTPVYAVRPSGGFTVEVYQRLVEFLAGQLQPAVDDPSAPHAKNEVYVSRVSIPGILTGETVRLFSGQELPVIAPQLRGMFAWNEGLLINSVLQKARETTEKSDPPQKFDADNVEAGLRNYLDRIYYDLRNLGQAPPDRALNYSATNIFQAATVFLNEALNNRQLDTISVERSPFCRKDSDCWDVKLIFFDPENVLHARTVHRYTIDVSAEFPVTVGPLRSWAISG